MTVDLSRFRGVVDDRLDYLAHRKAAEIPTMRQFLIRSWANVLHPSEILEISGAWYVDLICEWLTIITVEIGRAHV